MKKLVDIPDKDIESLKLLVGYEGHLDVSDAIRKAIKTYLRLNSNLIAKIDKREGKR